MADKLDQAVENGADIFGGIDLIEKISNTKINFDILIASPGHDATLQQKY